MAVTDFTRERGFHVGDCNRDQPNNNSCKSATAVRFNLEGQDADDEQVRHAGLEDANGDCMNTGDAFGEHVVDRIFNGPCGDDDVWERVLHGL